ncbi:hypothetical protein BXZ70DRAFT_1053806 [Cristinia sonorae]|uniref:WSC domain-containing protein n=1 Tax=Cristinia sonorae TaxID=1940300 RepID=A0A8K0XKB8_9AGAR|nr:hypothetical protein BXZ70DRAFT_1053806 [Cristinia sonorae]
MTVRALSRFQMHLNISGHGSSNASSKDMHLLSLVTLALIITSADGLATVCRFVCPDTVRGSTLLLEKLNIDGSVGDCFWFQDDNNAHEASFDVSGDELVPSADSEVPTRAPQSCTTVADGWSLLFNQVCYNTAKTLLKNDTIVSVADGNTPAACTAACDALGFVLAGVKAGSECHCATGTTSGAIPTPHIGCNIPCPGDTSLTCGGLAAIELFTKS